MPYHVDEMKTAIDLCQRILKLRFGYRETMLDEQICEKIFEFWEFSFTSTISEEYFDALCAAACAQIFIDLFGVQYVVCGADGADSVVGNSVDIQDELLDSAC